MLVQRLLDADIAAPGARAVRDVAVHQSDIDATLRALSAETTGRQITPQEVFDRVMNGATPSWRMAGASTAPMWRGKTASRSPVPTIAYYGHQAELAGAGVFTERIGYTPGTLVRRRKRT
jgi:hypothetical protein